MNGRAERSGALVESKLLNQFYFNTRKYAQELLDGLEGLVDWPLPVIQQQRNWIDRQEGYAFKATFMQNDLDCFSKHPSVDSQSSGVVVSVTNTLVSTNVDNQKELQEFIKRIPTMKKTHVFDTRLQVTFKNGQACNVYISPFMVHDPKEYLLLPLDSMDIKDTKLEKENVIPNNYKMMESTVTAVRYGFRDWLVSRQRNWGTPIPVINCSSCGVYIVVFDCLIVYPRYILLYLIV